MTCVKPRLRKVNFTPERAWNGAWKALSFRKRGSCVTFCAFRSSSQNSGDSPLLAAPWSRHTTFCPRWVADHCILVRLLPSARMASAACDSP
jgi:hypothetical protein